jgi:(heptosyl)LPS beta-1,4-glucosyltransferase
MLTKDDEDLVERALAQVDFADEFVVVDSGSTDRTREVAAAAGAKVVEQEFLGWSRQRNAGAEAARNDWILSLDADEVVTPRLAESFRRVLSGPMDPRDGYSVSRRDDILGELMPNESRRAMRVGLVRLYNRRHTGYDPGEIVHERAKPPGRTIHLDGTLLHWRGRDVHDLMAAINRYASVEATALEEQHGARASYAKLMMRPLLRFLWCYVWKGGFRYGSRGLIWATLRASAEALRWAKLWERQNVDRAIKDPPPRILDRG